MDQAFTDRRRTVLISLIVAVAVGLVAYVLLRPPTFRQLAERYRACVVSGDAACVRRMLTRQELEDNPASDADVKWLLDWAVGRDFAQGRPLPFDSVGSETDGAIAFNGGVVTSRGEMPFNVVVADTDDGIKVVDGYSTLALLGALRQQGGPLPHGLRKLRVWTEQLPKAVPSLAEHHFAGVRPQLGQPLRTWRDQVEDMKDRLARAEAGAPGAGASPR